MGVHDKEVIDKVIPGLDGKAYLVVYCAGRLGHEFTFEDLAEKIELYLEYATEGGLIAKFPHLENRPVVLRVSCEYWPPAAYKDRFAKMARQIELYGIELQVEVSNLRVKGGTFSVKSTPEA